MKSFEHKIIKDFCIINKYPTKEFLAALIDYEKQGYELIQIIKDGSCWVHFLKKDNSNSLPQDKKYEKKK